ncbi:MAG TPA: putative rhamnosyl transferase [Candidatus Stackebrandtia excrementipullorum]|nr:putative rhamnosyl transferase [Candidatus Stackebrandtia excrementipullorum]
MRSGASGFVHVLSTRVGIGVYDEAWFDYRLKLFSAVTVPSIAAQTCQDFTWLLVVDKQMPPKARGVFDEVIKPLKNVVVLEVEFKADFRKTVARWSKEYAAVKRADFVLSSRLDDDDALHITAFERIHAETDGFFTREDLRFAVFSLNVGCMWLPSKGHGYTRYHDSLGIGLSLMEPAESVETVYAHPHRDIKQRLTPRGSYMCGVDGAELWWLYAAHTISDSDKGDGKRHQRIINHKYGYSLDRKTMQRFGLIPEQIAGLREVGEPIPRQATKFLSLRTLETEKQIRSIRSELTDASWLRRRLLTQRLSRLERERVQAGSNIVE